MRDALVRTRTRYISVVRSLLRREGIRVRSGAASSFVDRVGELSSPQALKAQIEPLLVVMEKVNEEIGAADRRLAVRAKEDEVVRRLCTAPAVGAVTGVAFRAALDDARRFRGAHQVESYLGLVPREYSSGRNRTGVGSPRAATLGRDGCWWKRAGRSGDRKARRPKPCGGGRSRSRRGGVSASRWSRWLVGWRGSCLRSGETGRRSIRRRFARPIPESCES